MLPGLIKRATGENVPAHDAVTRSGEATNLVVPVERTIDGVQLLCLDGAPQLAVGFEMQHRPERSKEIDWPYFTTALRLEHQCPAVMVVVTVSAKTAEWARKPIDVGLGMQVMRPIVVCLEELEPGDDMGLMLLFALSDRASREDLEHLWRAINTVPASLASQYADIVGVGLFGTDSYEIWRDLMKIEDIRYQHPYAQELIEKGQIQGELKGEARAVLRILASRGIDVPERLSRKILACQDKALLEHWLDNVAVTVDIERLFSE
jgi:hypothetical protein